MPWQLPLLPLAQQVAQQAHCNDALPQQNIPWHVLECDDEARLLAASQAGAFDALLPEWLPMRYGSHQYQHRHHDFTLEVHTLKVIHRTRQSPYFQRLSKQQQRFVTLAALLHDVAKLGYTEAERPTAPPDAAHPVKGSVIVKQRLPWWGYPPDETQTMARLVEHHQLFGRLLMKHNHHGTSPTPQEFQFVALTLQSETMLDLLLPLTEGDIRSVKAEDAIFTPALAVQLADYSQQVRGYLHQLEAARQASGLATQLASSAWHWWIHPDYLHPSEATCPCGLNTLPDTILLPMHPAPIGQLPEGWQAGVRVLPYADWAWQAPANNDEAMALYYNLYPHQRRALGWGQSMEELTYHPQSSVYSTHSLASNPCLKESRYWQANPIAQHVAINAQASEAERTRLHAKAQACHIPIAQNGVCCVLIL